MNKREIGTFYEREAARYLKGHGVRICELNFRCRQGEIDIIGYDGTCLVFFEVKARDSLRGGSGAEAVHLYKQRKICRVSDYYRMKFRVGEFSEQRYDCVIINQGKITWIKGAFDYIR